MNRSQTSPLSAPKGGQGGVPAPPEISRRKLRNDLILIVALLLTVAVLGLGFFLLSREGETVTVEVNGETYGVYPLSEDTVVDIVTGADDDCLNRLVIREGEAYVEAATCPDGICAAHKPISRDGEAIVCLPHRVVIMVRTGDGASESKKPDVIA